MEDYKNIKWTVQFMFTFGNDLLNSHWGYYDNEEQMKKEIQEWKEKSSANSCSVFEGKFDPYDDEE